MSLISLFLSFFMLIDPTEMYVYGGLLVLYDLNVRQVQNWEAPLGLVRNQVRVLYETG